MFFNKAYNLGKKAYKRKQPRDPMRDHKFLAHIQTKASAKHHPNSPGADMSPRQRRRMEKKMVEWKRGWDEEHRLHLEGNGNGNGNGNGKG